MLLLFRSRPVISVVVYREHGPLPLTIQGGRWYTMREGISRRGKDDCFLSWSFVLTVAACINGKSDMSPLSFQARDSVSDDLSNYRLSQQGLSESWLKYYPRTNDDHSASAVLTLWHEIWNCLGNACAVCFTTRSRPGTPAEKTSQKVRTRPMQQ